ncbi:hypothetical protein H5410_047905 [Solanum commersonii]|uniref:Ubiquitin-like protease family profile domain-containing protein n=1 Tax=Solanum commersonii TaxID=4109 RepID=A0A9J5XIR0_SOLCO|nr:hypothetical protein H5410_047905 [Solanum commersonii]
MKDAKLKSTLPQNVILPRVDIQGKKPYTDALNVISPAFELGICNVAERHWFFKLAHSGQEWCDEENMKSTRMFDLRSSIVCSRLKITTSFFQLCDARENKKNYKVKDSDDIARYICGHRLLASTSWDKRVVIDSCRFDIVQRSLEVYDSFPRSGVNFEVKNIVEMLSIVLPYYPSNTKYSGIDEFEKIEFHFITKGVPRQQDDSLDCGVFVATFAEFVSNGQHILNQQVKADILRKRFGAILWEYARRKQASDLEVKTKTGKIKKYSYIS